ncbi:MAG: hypothetical protein IJ334_12450, partial [Clostridia bacterium]|nr:hypothetical protein [Clostridia bacterium]
NHPAAECHGNPVKQEKIRINRMDFPESDHCETYIHVTSDMQKNASNIVGNFITDIFGEELKPWQNEENPAKVP